MHHFLEDEEDAAVVLQSPKRVLFSVHSLQTLFTILSNVGLGCGTSGKAQLVRRQVTDNVKAVGM